MKLVSLAICTFALIFSGYVIASPPGPYRVMAYNSNGERLPENLKIFGVVFKESPLIAQDKTAIPKAINYLCEQYPDATIKIVDFNTQEELVDNSPSKCQ